MQVVGIVSPGAMGSALAARLGLGGARTVVALEGRSARTRRLAGGLDDVGSLTDLVRVSDVVLSVVPPGDALAVAHALVEAAGRSAATPLAVDLNAVSPATAAELERVLASAGLELVDGSISGPPPTADGTTRMYLAGPRAAEVAALPFDGVDLRVVGGAVGLASVVKMCTASVYKGRVALLAQALRTAHANGVLEPVFDDLVETGLADRARTGQTLARASTKAWRYVAEMREIASTQAAAGLTPELFQAFAQVYEELAGLSVAACPEDVDAEVDTDQLLTGWKRPAHDHPR